MIELKSEREIQIIKQNGNILAKTMKLVGQKIQPGIKTIKLDSLAEEFIKKQGAYPAFKGYRGFPASICVSINDEVVHGIPGERTLKEGEIVSVDMGVFKDGYYSDAACTYPVGEVTEEALRLIQVTRQALEKAINYIQAGRYLSDVSHAIQTFVEGNGFSVVRDLVGHGIGKRMHEDPQIPNFGDPGQGVMLKKGMALAIEPMVSMGSYQIETKDDHWTIITQDGSLSAHFEHTVAVTENGAEVLTK